MKRWHGWGALVLSKSCHSHSKYTFGNQIYFFHQGKVEYYFVSLLAVVINEIELEQIWI